jgi:hypothetical protein
MKHLIEFNQRIEFNCKECNGVKMVSVFPTHIDLDDIENMQDFCEFLNEGYIPHVVSNDDPIKWCLCKKDNQKQNIIDIMKSDEEDGLYNENK